MPVARSHAILLCFLCVAPLHAQSTPAATADRLFQRGSAAFTAGRLPEARSEFMALVRQFPRIAAAHTALGTVLLALGDPGAVAELEAAHHLDPNDTRTLLTLGAAQKSAGRYPAAAEAFRSAQAKGATLSPDESLAYAVALSANGAAAAAQHVLEAAVASSGSPALLDALGTVLAQGGHLPDAEGRLEQALTADARYAPAHAHLGSVLLAMNQPAPAASEFKKAIDLGDTSALTAVQLGRAEFALGNYEAAIEAEKKALLLQPGLYEGQYALALALQAAGRVDESLPVFAEALKSRPADAELLTNYGLAVVQKGDAPGALKLYARALAAGGASATLHEDMGVAYLQQNDIEHAVEQFRAGLLIDPGNVHLHYDLGLAWKLKDDVLASTAELRKAEELDPQLPDPPYTLGVLLMQGGNFAEASEQLQKAVALQPANGEAWSLLGSVYKQAGDGAKAAAALREAVRLLPGQPSPHVTLAAVLAESGDREGAAAERKIAADLSRSAVGHQRAEFSVKSGRALLAANKVEEAVVQFQAAVNAEPGSPAAHLALADALSRAGRGDEALAERNRGNLLSGSPAQTSR